VPSAVVIQKFLKRDRFGGALANAGTAINAATGIHGSLAVIH
jgi:hypothetical protein